MEKTHHVLVLVLVLTVLAALPRFYGLGSLGFYGDEETTAFPARAFAQGEGAEMPSGMAYRRALPFTWLNGLAAYYLGTKRELAYRLPAAIFGTLTIPLLFFAAWPLVGGRVALLAAVLLAFSEWHIATSREARMYAPFLLFYVGAAFATLRWATTGQGRYLMLALLLFTVSVSLHALGIIGIMFAVIPIAFAGWARVAPARLVTASVVGGSCAYAYSHYFVDAGYKEWISAHMAGSAASVTVSGSSWLEALASLPVLTILLGLIGAGLGFWAAMLGEPKDSLSGRSLRSAARYVCAILTGSLVCTGQLYGASISMLLFLYLHPGNRPTLAMRTWLPVGIMALIALGWTVTRILESGWIGGFKTLVAFPFPYPFFFAEMFPLVLLLFFATMMYFALQPHQPDEFPLRACVLAVILPVAAIGAISKWGGIRYLFEVYPFLLIAAAAALLSILDVLGRVTRLWSEKSALALACGIVVSGVLTGYGIPQSLKIATLVPGERVDQRIYAYPFYPDHKSPGEFVRRNLGPNDIVIAEDPLEQRWYVGRADYWFRRLEDARPFTYEIASHNRRDIYVDSILLDDLKALNSIIQRARGRVWFITSGETYPKRDYYLSPEQARWLRSLEKTRQPVFVGRDKITKVFCLNCTGSEKLH
jgi:hypothetical protein